MYNNNEEIFNGEKTDTPKYTSFMFFGSIRESVEALSEEDGNKLLRAVMLYGTEGILENDNPLIYAILLSIKPNIDKASARYKEKIENSKKYRESQKTKKTENY